jgi:3-methyladenine DNA glycosylase Mpg
MSHLLSDALRHPSDQVAPWLLGQRITSDSNEGRVSIELTEVEAYAGLGLRHGGEVIERRTWLWRGALPV